MPPRNGEATPLRIAANAVMAGCRPEYFPLVLLAIEAMCEKPFNLYGLQTTTHPVAPLVIVNGPVAAELDINGEQSYRATLCRCGASQKKPFCDGSHGKVGFTATGEPASKESPSLEVRNGPVKVTPQPNGCLKIEGNLEIVTGTGRTVDRTTKAFLCRCGQSQNKPFCDGTHKKVGFVA